MSDRLISAGKLTESINRQIDRATASKTIKEMTRLALLVEIWNAPTVDAVEVVRCKDCKHNSLNRISGNAYCDLGIRLCHLDDFCSYGERRDDGEIG